ncbi:MULTISPECIES: Ldh family oxidoreductase [Brevibacterium]|uniref:Lactate dehydrogenase n=1 Tax=Brevibacterium sediminis TaxID=1857024 RepID=A0ABQ1MN84_9MICO|nr:MULTISPECIES: Ldh family oxidoreductase [Brevibacterium]GGC43572.1 lactate dehydrogenase [Brevibacterium sediminis]
MSTTTTSSRARTDAERWIEFAASVLRFHGVPDADANLVAGSLVQADLWGHQSHGLLRLPWYVARLRTGAMKAKSEPSVVADTGGMLLLDGDDGIGQVLTDRIAREAADRARTNGIGAVGVRNSNHFGMAMYYTRRIAAEGFAAMLYTNASPAMAPWGGREKRIGTNPWSMAAPYGDSQIALDIANTAVARGKIYLADQRREDIPDGWALDAEGRRTTNAAEAINGVILPMAGHKGYAISLMMDIFTGALLGGAVGTDIHGPYEADKKSGTSHLFIAVDPRALGTAEEFDARIAELVGQMHSTPLAHGHDQVFLPGEIEDHNAATTIRLGGIEYPEQTWKDMEELGSEASVDLP